MQQNSTLLTVGELASRLRVPVSWVYSRSRQRGQDSIPCVRVGKYYRFYLSEVLAWLENQPR